MNLNQKYVSLIVAGVVAAAVGIALVLLWPGSPSAPSSLQPLPIPPGSPVTYDDKKGNDVLRVVTPARYAVVGSPLTIAGEARGYWYFEASFPFELLDEDGNVLVSHYATARGEWMTTDYVPFSVTVPVPATAGATGTLVLKKDNPSGLPEHDDEVRIPVRFRTGTLSTGGCVITGCSGQVCGEEDVITTCEYLEEYACYREGVCERQKDGTCGWTVDAALAACVNAARR